MILTTIALTLGLAVPATPLEFKLPDIDGKQVPLEKFKGKVVMLVNVASKCGLTPQYDALQATFAKYQKQGFVILGFPANEFGSQEPGTNAEIKEFCTGKYHVTFPMFSKIVVKGEGIHPLYAFLTGEATNPKFAGEITWNFTKFLLDKKGNAIARFEPKTKPDDAKVLAAIESALSASP